MTSVDFKWKQKADLAIGQGALTNSKRPESHVMGVYPTHVKRGFGPKIMDMWGNEYLDYICGLGANILGYGHNKINLALIDHIKKGYSHSLPTYKEVEVAEKLKGKFLFCERFKFLKTGSEACSAAVKMARAYTGRRKVLSHGYHGWHDLFVSLTPPAKGVVGEFQIEKLDEDLSKVDLTDVACVIIEPVIDHIDRKRIDWLKDLREKCTKAGTVLIYDEVITGFRFDELSVANHTGIKPDLIILGKAMANGMPLSAVGGSKDILDGDYFVSSTYAGELLSLVACDAVMDILTKQKVRNLWLAGEQFLEEFNKAGNGIIQIRAYPTRGVFVAEEEDLAIFFQEACKAGILFCKSWFYSVPLIEHKDYTIRICSMIIEKMKRKEFKLHGNKPKPAFAQNVREAKEGAGSILPGRETSKRARSKPSKTQRDNKPSPDNHLD